MFRSREDNMRRVTKVVTAILALVGLVSGQVTLSRETSNHVLADAVMGKIKPAKIMVQPVPGAASISKSLPFFSSGSLVAAAAALQGGVESAGKERSQENFAAPATAGGQTKNTIRCSDRT
jgi:hypothetical protein